MGSDEKRWMNVSSDGSGMWKEWRMTGLLRGYMYGSVLVVAQPRNRWIDTVNDCLKKKCLDVGQAKSMGDDRACEGKYVGCPYMGMNPWL